MPRRWSKLQRRIYEIFEPSIHLQFHCAVYRISGHVNTVCPRYFLMLNGEIIWDWPRDYMRDLSYEEMYLICRQSASDISNLAASYLNADRKTALVLRDGWGILDIFRAADRRLGYRQWNALQENINPKVELAVEKIINARRMVRKTSMKNKKY